MADFRTWAKPKPRNLVFCVLFGLGCAPIQSPEDPEGTKANPSARDSSGQSYAEAVTTVCDVDRLSGADPSDPLRAASQRDEYLVEHVKNADGIYFLTVFRTQAGLEQADSLAREAKVAQVARCPLAQTLRAEGAEAPSAAKH